MKTTPSGKAYRWLLLISFVSVCFTGPLKALDFAVDTVLPSGNWEVRALVYHRFGDQRYPSTNTTVGQFESHLKWLVENGYESLLASEVYGLPKKEMGKYVCITVDDGYKSFYQNALPLLQKYKMKATLYVNTESVGWADYCTWGELKELQVAGIEIGNHSHNHDYFLNTNDRERAGNFESDCLLAEKLFEEFLGMKPQTYAYPFGEFSADMMSILRKRGYKMAFAQNSGVWSGADNRYEVPRFPMSGRISEESFRSKVSMRTFRLQKSHPGPVLISNNVDTLDLTYYYDINLYSGPINCFVNGALHKDCRMTKGEIRLRLAPRNRRRSLVTFTTKDKEGNWCWFSQLLINPDLGE